MNTIIKVEVCDMVVSGCFEYRRLKVIDICRRIGQKYPVEITNFLYENVRTAVLEIFPCHRNNRKHTKYFRVSSQKASDYVEKKNIRMRSSYACKG